MQVVILKLYEKQMMENDRIGISSRHARVLREYCHEKIGYENVGARRLRGRSGPGEQRGLCGRSALEAPAGCGTSQVGIGAGKTAGWTDTKCGDAEKCGGREMKTLERG